jgi:hypothetical protein
VAVVGVTTTVGLAADVMGVTPLTVGAGADARQRDGNGRAVGGQVSSDDAVMRGHRAAPPEPGAPTGRSTSPIDLSVRGLGHLAVMHARLVRHYLCECKPPPARSTASSGAAYSALGTTTRSSLGDASYWLPIVTMTIAAILTHTASPLRGHRSAP